MEINDTTSIGLARSVRIKVLIDLKKPLKRGTRIRIDTSEPCWIPTTYERLPSFCYWCGKSGHSFKDCDDYHERDDQGDDAGDRELPYGDWMKASPMKQAQIVLEKGKRDYDKLRRSLFSQQREGNHTGPSQEDIQEQQPRVNLNTEQKVSELLQSPKKVRVDETNDDALSEIMTDTNPTRITQGDASNRLRDKNHKVK